MKPYTPKLEGPIYYDLESLSPFSPPPKKTYFYEKAQNMLKFEKVGFLGVKRGFLVLNPPK